MKAILPLSIICLSLAFLSCQKESEHSGYVDENEALVEKLSEVSGDMRTYNFDFKILENPKIEGVSFYEPTSISEGFSSIPTELKDAIHLPNIADLPFTMGTEKANIVTFWNTTNTLIFQIQISYFENDTDYKADNLDFLIISATQLAENPFIDTSADDDPIDEWIKEFKMNIDEQNADEIKIYEKLELTDELPLFFKEVFNEWSIMYPYYSYDSENKNIEHTSTGSKMYYAWHDGVIFQIGYKFLDDTVDTETLVKKIILGL